jgi:hypothetical protein
MLVNKLNKKGVIYLNKSVKLIEEMKKNKDYNECINVINGLIEFFKEDNDFCKILNQLKKSTETLMYENTFVSGIECKTCKTILETMTMKEHLDKNNPKNKCKCNN